MRKLTLRLVVCAAAIVVGAAVWLGAEVQHDSAVQAARESDAAQTMLTALLDEQAGLRGFQLTGDTPYLQRRRQARAEYEQALADLRPVADDHTQVRRALDGLQRAVDRWRDAVDDSVDGFPRESFKRLVQRTTVNERLMRDLRNELAALRIALDDVSHDDEQASAITTVVLALAAFLVVAAIGLLLFRRRIRTEAAAAAREQAFRDQQAEFSQALLSASSEDEAHHLLKRYLEQDGRRTVTVLESDGAHERLTASTPLAEDDRLAEPLAGAVPRDCVAVRLGAPHEEAAGSDPLLRCDLCGACGGDRLCSPLFVSGEVIGSVLSVQRTGVAPLDRRRVEAAVTIAAPVLANLRTIEVAQSRAATDGLTGLANRRALDDALARMTAQTLRSQTSLAVIGIDLDHFKAINDQFGHDAGDEVLQTVAAVLRAGTRAGDFVGRWGGEEFCVIAPDTPADGALALAENLRATVDGLVIPGIERDISASFGVAVCPDHAVSAELLLRQADRALYAAKHGGRNRVELAGAKSPTPTPA